MSDLPEVMPTPLETKTWPEIAVLPSLGSHEDVVIVGNEQALRALRDTIDAALRDGAAEMPAMLMRDGEGYGIIVVKKDGRMDEVPLHYAESMLFPSEWPEWLLAAHAGLRR